MSRRGRRVTSYVITVARNAARDYWRRAAAIRDAEVLESQLADPASGDDGRALARFAAPFDLEERALGDVTVERLLAVLTPREARVVRETVLRGRTEASVARELGCSQQRVHAVKARALARMARHAKA